MFLGVSWVDELPRDKAVGDLTRQFFGFGDRALHAFGAFGEHQFRTVSFENIATFHAHGLRHGENQAVATRSGH